MLSNVFPSLSTLRRCLFVDNRGSVNEVASGRAASAPEPLPEEIGLILYTSGTTGAPKGALIRHTTPADGAVAVNSILNMTPSDVCFLVIPVSHAFGLLMLFAALAAGWHAH